MRNGFSLNLIVSVNCLSRGFNTISRLPLVVVIVTGTASKNAAPACACRNTSRNSF
jgi:hypothetical protein